MIREIIILINYANIILVISAVLTRVKNANFENFIFRV